MVDTYQEVPAFSALQVPERQWILEFEKDESYLAVVTKGDIVYQNFKYDRKSNYKVDIKNTLGFLEHPKTFALLHQAIASLAMLSDCTDGETAKKAHEEFCVAFDIWAKTLAEIDISNRRDHANYVTQLMFFQVVMSMVSQIVRAISFAKSLSGESALQEILDDSDIFTSIASELPKLNESSEELKTDFVAALLQSSLIAVALEILSESLKSCVPSGKKKKKGANPVLEEV